MNCKECKYDYVCCSKFGVTLSRDEVLSGEFAGKTVVLPLTENKKILGYVVTLAKKSSGSCVFYDDSTHECKIYEKRPNACRNFDCDKRLANAT